MLFKVVFYTIKKTANFFVQVRGPGITYCTNKKARDVRERSLLS